MSVELDTRKFWNAASYYRRAPHRDQAIAVRVLEDLTRNSSGRPQMRAAQLLRQINGTCEPPASA